MKTILENITNNSDFNIEIKNIFFLMDIYTKKIL